MDARELMIGDIVRVTKDVCIRKGSIVRVLAVDGTASLREKGLCGYATCEVIGDKYHTTGGVWCEFLEPVPVTTKNLEKNFKREGGGCHYFDDEHGVCIEFYSDPVTEKYIVLYTNKGKLYVKRNIHDIQHALFVSEVDKEIII